MRKPRPQTDQASRSLLQKAVRRGHLGVVERSALRLSEIGDSNWLKMRAAIISFEECWPLAADLDLTTGLASTFASLLRVTSAVKHKDAAGLGVLSYSLSQGDDSVLLGGAADRDIRIVAAAIERPNDFWNWAAAQSVEERQLTLLANAHKSYRRGGWPWDRAVIQAAAYLAISCGVPETKLAQTVASETDDFPYWVAIDKHTPGGKTALREAARLLKLPYRQLAWASFYLESANTNELAASQWWGKEAEWRLRRVNLTIEGAECVWQQACPVVRDLVFKEAEALRQRIANGSAADNLDHDVQETSDSLQLALFAGHEKG